MAEYNGRHYYKIDVMGRNGYSFMVSTPNELDYEDDAVHIALDLGCFECDKDASYAVVDDLVSVHDIEHFIECGCCYNY